MPGPMSIPNGSNEIVTITEMVDVIGKDGKPKKVAVKRKIALQSLTGQQRVALAARGQLNTGKTRKNHDRK